jgi:hypothetical protein
LQTAIARITAMIEEANCHVVRSMPNQSNGMVEMEVVLDAGADAQDLGDRIKKAIDDDPLLAFRGVAAKWTREIDRRKLMHPEPPYLYDYQPTEVQCCECLQRFSHDELEADSAFDGEDESWSNEICPKCGEWNCCEIEYEELTREMLSELRAVAEPQG